MNKLTPLIALSLIVSMGVVWYVATKSPTTRTPNSNILVVGTNAEFAPFSFMQNNQISGFDIDIINEIANRIGKTIELQDMPFDALIHALQNGSVQVIASGITPTQERAKQVIFTQAYLSGDPLLIVSSASKPLTTLDQLKDKKVAVNEGFTADSYMSKISGPELVRFATVLESFMALESDRIDALVGSRNSVKPFIDQYGTQKFSRAEIPETNDEYALAISKQHPELLEPIQKALDTMIADGTLNMLKEKWHLH